MEQMSFKHIFYVKTQAINFVDQIMNFVNSLLSVLCDSLIINLIYIINISSNYLENNNHPLRCRGKRALLSCAVEKEAGS